MFISAFEFLVVMFACALNRRMQKKLDDTQTEVRVLTIIGWCQSIGGIVGKPFPLPRLLILILILIQVGALMTDAYA